MADVKISALPVANNTDTLTRAGVQNSVTVQIPGAADLAQTLRDLGYTPAPINSPTFTGDPKAPTPAPGDSDTSLATTAFVTNAISTAVAPLGDALLGTPNHQTGTSYTLAASDLNLVVECDNASPFTLTVPLNATVAIPVGWFTYFTQFGIGQVTVTPGTGAVTIKNAASLTTRTQNSFLGLTKIATDTWLLWGDMT